MYLPLAIVYHNRISPGPYQAAVSKSAKDLLPDRSGAVGDDGGSQEGAGVVGSSEQNQAGLQRQSYLREEDEASVELSEREQHPAQDRH